MKLTVQATYENGVLKPDQPLPFRDQERVQLTVESKKTWVEETYGILGFKGTAEEADYFALDPELDYPPPTGQP